METQENNAGANGADASKPGLNKRWYVVHAYSGFEKSVAQALRDRIARTGMEDRFGDVLVPTEEVVEMRAGQKRRSERKFFPGYVLVQIVTHEEGGIPRIDSESWHLIKETPKVMGFIGGTADKPLPIRDDEADAIRIAKPKWVGTTSASASPPCSRRWGCGRRDPAARAGRGREAASEGAVRGRADGARHRRPVQRLQRRGRGSQLREEPPARGGADLRALDAGGAGIRPGREGLTNQNLAGASGSPRQ